MASRSFGPARLRPKALTSHTLMCPRIPRLNEDAALGLLDLLKLAAAFTRLEPTLKRLAKRKELRGRLRDLLMPVLTQLDEQLDGVTRSGETMKTILAQANPTLSRNDTIQLWLVLADIMDTEASLIEGARELAKRAKSVMSFETFMNALKESDEAGYELIRLFDRSYRDGILDVREYPAFATLYGPKGRAAKKFEREVKEAVVTATPMVKKAKSVRARAVHSRQVETRLRRTARHLRKVQGIVRSLDREEAKTMEDLSPDWIEPLLVLAKEAGMR